MTLACTPPSNLDPSSAGPDVSRCSDLALAKLLRLASPALPVGGYSYSQGLEWAIEQGGVHDLASAEEWISDVLRYTLATYEGPVWCRLYGAWNAGDIGQVDRWNRQFLASRESRELRAESAQMGFSLKRLLCDLGDVEPGARERLCALEEPSYPAAFSFAAAAWHLPLRQGLLGYFWSWAENQALAAVKAIPLGQVAGQKILGAVAVRLGGALDQALSTADDALSNSAPGLAIASSLHETQYSRLFRS